MAPWAQGLQSAGCTQASVLTGWLSGGPPDAASTPASHPLLGPLGLPCRVSCREPVLHSRGSMACPSCAVRQSIVGVSVFPASSYSGPCYPPHTSSCTFRSPRLSLALGRQQAFHLSLGNSLFPTPPFLINSQKCLEGPRASQRQWN